MTNVEVVIPEIKLALADLAYMRGLLPGEQRCSCPSNKTRDKLIFLGLIEEGDIKPSDKDVAEWQTRINGGWKDVADALKTKDTTLLYRGENAVRYSRKPEAVKGWFLSAAGKALLKSGHTKTTISKKGCA